MGARSTNVRCNFPPDSSAEYYSPHWKKSSNKSSQEIDHSAPLLGLPSLLPAQLQEAQPSHTRLALKIIQPRHSKPSPSPLKTTVLFLKVALPNGVPAARVQRLLRPFLCFLHKGPENAAYP